MFSTRFRLRKRLRVFFRRNTPAWNIRQIILLFILALLAPQIIPHLIYNENLRLAPFHSLEVSATTFAVCLPFYHVFFWSRQNISSRNTPKYVDYVYLTIAVIGLLGASDIDSRVYRRDVENFVYFAQSHLQLGSMMVANRLEGCDVNKTPGICDDLRRLRVSIDDLAIHLDMRESTLDQAEQAVQKLNSNLSAYPDIRKSLDDNFATSGIDFDAEARALQNKPFSIDYLYPWFGFGATMESIRQLGFALIASALALRITKVSVEIFGWYRRS